MKLNFRTWIGPGLASFLISAPVLAVPIEGEITKITKGRQSFMVDLAGNATLDNGATVELTIDGKQRTGTVKKVAENGKAFIKLSKGLPKAVNVGDTVQIDAGTGAAEGTSSAGSVQLKKGGNNKAYWNEISFLAAHRKPGTRADLELGYLGAQGADKASGGANKENTEYAVTDKHTTFSGGAGWVGRGGVGGGALLNYDSSERAESASIRTAATSTTDSDGTTAGRKVTQIEPYIEYLDRANTGGLGFGGGLGIPIRMTQADRHVKVASVETKFDPAKTTQTGVELEGLVGNDNYAFIIGLTPVLSGKIKQAGEADVDRKSGEYALHYENYGRQLKWRVGVTLGSSEDSYTGSKLTESATKFSGTVDWSLGMVDAIPFLNYTRTSRKRGDASGTFRTTDFGARVAWSGVYAPFVSVSLSNESGDEKNDAGRHSESTVGGFRMAGGLNI